MPRGVPKAGFRNMNKNKFVAPKVVYDTDVTRVEPEHVVSARIRERFDILETLTRSCIDGLSRALIVSGPAGLGKSYTVEKALERWDPNAVNHTIIKGFVRATGLYKQLHRYRSAGQVVVFDDADSVFFDDTALNLLKAVCDTTDRRRVSWLSEGKLIDEETGEVVPTSFDFEGTVIFITNYDFDGMIERDSKLAPHLQALISRSHYVDLSMKSRQDYLVRIKQVVGEGLLDHLTEAEKEDVTTFIDLYADRLRELSLRMAIKIAALRKANDNWERVAVVTCCRN